jgi:hypothetical protein
MAIRVLEGREKILGPDHLKTLDSVSQLARILDSKGNMRWLRQRQDEHWKGEKRH